MIRFAILIAVSSKAQAEDDKVSLAVQEQRCRETALARGWVEVCGPYSVPGESRQRWVNLRDAEIAIPQLKVMLDHAQAHKFDILVIYDYNRLRDLLDPVSKSLSHYNAQIFSISQPVEPVHPDKYSPYTTDISILMETLAKMTSRVQNNDLRRKYMTAMPRRASERGLPVHIPFGYLKARDSKTAPDVDPDLSKYVIEMKDMLLSGKSTLQIAEYMQGTGVSPKGQRWYSQTIRQIVTNPFYAGIVRWGISKSELDPRTGRIRRNRKIDPENFVTGPGKHQALWDEKTYREILAELHRRRKSYKGKSTQTLTGLLSCGICTQRLWAFYNHSVVSAENLTWRCSSRMDHVAIRNPTAIHTLGMQMTNDLINMADHPEEHQTDDGVEKMKTDLLDFQDQLERVNNAYQAGAFTLAELTSRKTILIEEIARLEAALEKYIDAEDNDHMRAVILADLRSNLGKIPKLLAGVPQDVNYILHKILSDIKVQEDGSLSLTWK